MLLSINREPVLSRCRSLMRLKEEVRALTPLTMLSSLITTPTGRRPSKLTTPNWEKIMTASLQYMIKIIKIIWLNRVLTTLVPNLIKGSNKIIERPEQQTLKVCCQNITTIWMMESRWSYNCLSWIPKRARRSSLKITAEHISSICWITNISVNTFKLFRLIAEKGKNCTLQVPALANRGCLWKNLAKVQFC